MKRPNWLINELDRRAPLKEYATDYPTQDDFCAALGKRMDLMDELILWAINETKGHTRQAANLLGLKQGELMERAYSQKLFESLHCWKCTNWWNCNHCRTTTTWGKAYAALSDKPLL